MRIGTITLPLLCLLAACTETAEQERATELEKELDIRLEVLHQTRALLRYQEEEEKLRREWERELYQSP